MKKRILLMGLIIAVSVMRIYASGSHEPRLKNWEHTSTYRVPFHSIKVSVKGYIELSEDDNSVVAIAPDALLYVRETKGSRTAELKVEGTPNNEPDYTLWVNGTRRILIGNNNDTIAGLLQTAGENFGVGRSSKMDRYYREDGIDKALSVLEPIRSGGVVTYLFDRFTRSHDFEIEESIAIIEATDLIHSSSDLTDTLKMLAKRFDDSDRVTAALMIASREIASSSSATEAVISVARTRELRQESARAMARTIELIPSSSDKLEALETMALKMPADEDTISAYLEAARTIASSGDLAEAVLKLDYESMSESLFRDYFKVVETISSSNDKARVLVKTVRKLDLNDAAAEAYLQAARTIVSSSDKTEAIVALGATELSDESLVRVFSAIEGIASSSDKTEALTSFLDDRELSPDALRSYLDAARTIASSSDKAEGLTAALKYVDKAGERLKTDAELKEVFIKTIESIASSSDREECLRLLVRVYD